MGNADSSTGASLTEPVVHTMQFGGYTEHRIDHNNFRHIFHNGKNSQIGSMVLPAGYTLAREQHEDSDQYFFIVSGTGHANLEDYPTSKKSTVSLSPGSVLMVDANTWHEIVASTRIELLTVYAKPQHKDGTIRRQPE